MREGMKKSHVTFSGSDSCCFREGWVPYGCDKGRSKVLWEGLASSLWRGSTRLRWCHDGVPVSPSLYFSLGFLKPLVKTELNKTTGL